MSDILPLFHSAGSLKQGGIFTVEKAGALAKLGKKRGPVSLCDLAKQEKLTQLHLVEDRMVNFMTAYKNLKEVGCQLVFGWKVVVCEDIAVKDEASFKTESKVIVWMNGDGSTDYQALLSLVSKASQDGFYYVPRLDWKTLKALWHPDLLLSLPFYSSFLARNTLTFASIVPDLPARPIVTVEENELPFDPLLKEAATRYAAANGLAPQPTKSIYYRDRAQAKGWQIWRAILDRQSFDKPNMDGCCSREFSYESWKEQAR